ncbi:GNAT family N-acetyltransferase [Hahella ganghwensis]|uniref:GNAT family N-acetyltransferase n=1 Tax=Hahella ganghwensis TaxID=286420 RepID=UPI00037F9B68|nr:GNAT family N-acetyltransferase [Hahella ganghwensis]
MDGSEVVGSVSCDYPDENLSGVTGMYEWKYKSYKELSAEELFEILKVRQEVFIVEQNCVYPDIDDLDKVSGHLFATRCDAQNEHRIHAYLRILSPGFSYDQVSFGRVLTSAESRGNGLGKTLIAKTLEILAALYPGLPVKISAQLYLEKFYSGFGFHAVSEPYDEDGIPHIGMIMTPGQV